MHRSRICDIIRTSRARLPHFSQTFKGEPPPMLTIQNFRTSFRQVILKRGLDYVRQGRVHDLTRTPDGTVSATVSGSHDYPVRMQLSPNGTVQRHPAPAAEQSRPFQPRGRRRSGHHKNVGRRNTEAAGVKQTNRQRETISSKPSPPPLICPGELIRCNPTIRNKRDFHGFNRFRRQNPVRFQAAATIRRTNILSRTIPL